MKKIVLFFLLLSGIAQAQILDQSNTGSATNYEIINDFSTTFRQYFKAGLNGELTRLDLDMETWACNSTSSMQFHCNIYDSTYTVFLANELVTIPMPFTRGMHSIIFSTPANLVANETYLFEIFSFTQACDTGGTPSNAEVHFFHDLIDTNYPDGTAYGSPSPLFSDFYFQTFVSVCNNPISINASVTTPTTCGSNNGTLTCSPTGGDAALSYSWSNAETTQTISSLSSGNYTITVSDGLNCQASQTINLPNTIPAVFANDTTVATTCFGVCDGFASITVTAGSAPYTYLWSNTATTGSISSLCAGSYSYTVTDVNGCTFSNAVVVTQPNELTGSFIVTNESCQLGDGFLDLNPIGDFPPFTYSWGHGPVTQDVNNLSAGIYSVTILDNQGCTSLINETVAYEAGAVIDTMLLDIQNNLCFQSNGHIANLNGAVSTSNTPVNYTLNSQSISSLGAFNLLSGVYELIATDALGCSDSTTINILDIGSPITVNQGSTYTPSCPDECTGTIMVIVGGGSGSYTYSWSNGYTVANGMGLCAGEYTVVVTDSDGCTGSNVMTINPATPIVTSFNVTDATCGLNDGSATININSGGQAPFTYQWSDGSNAVTMDSVGAGNYSVMVTDANLCQAYRIVSVNNTTGPSVGAILVDPSCHGFSDGGIDLTISGGTPPINILWSTGHSSEDISSLNAGIYDVEISDASGCTINRSYQLFESSSISISQTQTPASCGGNDGDISITAIGGNPPLTYLWNAAAGNAITPVVNNLSAGIYEVTITDANGCFQSFNTTLDNDNAPLVNIDQVLNPNCQTGGGAIMITASGGTSPYSYSWSNGAISADLENVSEGIYSLIITDANNCIASNSFELPGINIFAQEICMITVDTATNMNRIIWEKTAGIGIEEFRIYRETSVPGNFRLVGRVPFDSLSIFQDTVASSDIHAWKYKLATVDSCGNESSFIASHKSIHLVTEADANGDVSLFWDDYIGFSYNEFYISRFHTSTGWLRIDTVSNAVHSYLDVNAPTGNLLYSIEVPAPSDCEPSRVGVNTSRSNVKNTPNAAGGNSINENENAISLIVFPNPAMNEVNISLENFGGEADLKLFNSIGDLLFVQKINSNKLTIATKNLPSGVYTISVSSEKNNIFKKLMIVK